MNVKQVGKVLVAGAAVTSTVFGLFGGVLEQLVPPSSELAPTVYAGIASVASLVVMLAIDLAMPARLTVVQRRWAAAMLSCIGVTAFYLLFLYIGQLNTFVFKHPDPPTARESPQRHIRGEYTQLGARITKDMSVSAAVESVGGLKMARDNQLLWTEESQKAIEWQLMALYVTAVSMLNAALIGVAFAVLRAGRARAPGSRGPASEPGSKRAA